MLKARRLSPAFDAECAANERPVGFWQCAGYAAGWLRARWVSILLSASLLWVFVKLLPLIIAAIKFLAVMLPVWLLLALFGWFRRPRRYPRYRF